MQLTHIFGQILYLQLILFTCFMCNRVYCIHVLGHDPLILSFRSFSFSIGWVFYGPKGVKTCALGRQRPFSPSVPAEAGCLFTVAAGVHVFITGESL